jgi:hypothetical protein
MTYLKVFGFTLLNIRYAALILPTGVVAYLLGVYVLAVVAGILLVAAFAAEVALSISNGIDAYHSVELAKRLQADEEQAIAQVLSDIEDWKNQHGSEDSAPEGEDPTEGQGQGPVPSR